jgi:hypothetical protein
MDTLRLHLPYLKKLNYSLMRLLDITWNVFFMIPRSNSVEVSDKTSSRTRPEVFKNNTKGLLCTVAGLKNLPFVRRACSLKKLTGLKVSCGYMRIKN